MCAEECCSEFVDRQLAVEKHSTEKEDFRIDSEVCCEGAHPLRGALSQRGLNQLS